MINRRVLVILAFFVGAYFYKTFISTNSVVYACECTCSCDTSCSSSPTGCNTSGGDNGCSGSCTDNSDGSCTCGGSCTMCAYYCNSGRCGSRSVNSFSCGTCGGSGPGGDCFAAGTTVTLADGTQKSIETVQRGDLIKTMNENGVEVISEVAAPQKSERYGYYKLSLSDGSGLEVTENHPIWGRVGNYIGWTSLDPLMTKLKENLVVEKLSVGDEVYKDNKTWVSVLDKTFVAATLSVYNLSLKGDEHSYFANGVYVHNKGCDDSAPGAPGLVSPADNLSCFDSNAIVLDWNGVSWGENCGGNSNKYEVYIDGAKVADVAENTTAYTYTGAWGSSHTWYIRATNGALATNSATWHFSVNTCTRVVGRVWEDLNFNGSYGGAPESWAYNPPPAANCAALLDNDINIRSPSGGSNVLAGWACNPGSYYYTTYFNIPGPIGTVQNRTFELVTPDAIDFPGRYVNWSYARCSGPACTPYASTSSGTNTNVATVPISNSNGRDWTNHLQWQVARNVPPTAVISTTVPAGHTMTVNGQPVYVIPTGTPHTFTATATETRATTPWRTYIGRRDFDPNTRVGGASFTNIGTNNSCAGLVCTSNIADASPQPGYYVYYPSVSDEIAIATGVGRLSNQCSGNPGVHTGGYPEWSDCDAAWGNGYQDEVVAFGDRIPICYSITGPNYLFSYPSGQPYVYPESTGWYSMRTTDPDGTEVKKLWSPAWTNADGLFPTIRQIRIYAAGSLSNGVGPEMQLWLGNNANGGSRGSLPTWRTTVSNIYPTWQAYTINGTFNNVSSIEIGFPNDSAVNGDRNLFIQRIEVTYDVRPGSSMIKTLYPYTMAGHGEVFYDRGAVAASPYYNNGSWFDGVDASVVSSSGAFSVAAGTMAWSGTYSFPVPIRSSTTGGTLSLSGTPMSSLPFYDGNSCGALAITNDANPTYTIRGTSYIRNAAQQCSAQGISANRIGATDMFLQDMSGNPIPGLSTTTQADGTYQIDNVPVFYRPDPFCASCGAQVCMDQMDPDVGVYLAACSQMEPPAPGTNSSWADTRLCSPRVSINPQITDGSVATVNLGFDYYENEKWSAVLDGDVYTPGITFDIAAVPGTNFSPYFINRRIDAGANATLGGFVFVDASDVDLGLPLTRANLAESGGYARRLENASGTYNFKDKWISTFDPVAPAHAVSNHNPRNGNHFRFDSNNVYVYTRDQFMNWYSDAAFPRYDITGPRSMVIMYVIGDPISETINLNRELRTSAEHEMIVMVTNLPIEIDDQVDISQAQVDGGAYTVNAYSGSVLTSGFLDFIILSSDDIVFDSRYDDTALPTTIHDLPIVVYGSLISKTAVALNRDLWHILNSDYPSETVRYYPRLLPQLMDVDQQNNSFPSFSGLGIFDIQTVYE